MLSLAATIDPHRARRVRRLRIRAALDRRRAAAAYLRSPEAELRFDPSRIRAGEPVPAQRA
jgi:hypothetical protein